MSIWNHKELKNEIAESSKLVTLGEGDTPSYESKNEGQKFVVKREDLNPTGSWKDRSTAFKLTKFLEVGVNEFVFASSGNAAISMLSYSNLVPEIKMHIVVSPNANPEKIEKIKQLSEGANCELYFETSAKKKVSEIAAQKKIKVLKSSIDEDSTKGYWSLGFELHKFFKNSTYKNNFLLVPVSSGAALVGTIWGLQTRLDSEYKMPRIVVLQTQSCNPIVRKYDENSRREKPWLVQNGKDGNVDKSLADSIVDQSAFRSQQILRILGNTNGLALTITNEMLIESEKYAKEKLKLDLSYTSLLSIAGFLQLQKKFKESQYVCIASGR